MHFGKYNSWVKTVVARIQKISNFALIIMQNNKGMETCSHKNVKNSFCSTCGALQAKGVKTFANFKKRVEINPLTVLTNLRDCEIPVEKALNNTFYLNKRKNLIANIREIADVLMFQTKTIFLAALILDKLAALPDQDTNLELLAISSLIVASKYLEIDPVIPNIKDFNAACKKFYFTVGEIKLTEVKVLKLMSHNLHFSTEIDFLSFYLGHGVVTKEDRSAQTSPESEGFVEKNVLITPKDLKKFIEEVLLCFLLSALVISRRELEIQQGR